LRAGVRCACGVTKRPPPIEPEEPMQVVATAGPAGHSMELRVRGELDLASAPDLAAALDVLVTADHRIVVLDLTELSFLDCAGMRPIRAALCALRSGGGSLVIRHPQPLVEQALRATGLGDALEGSRRVLSEAGAGVEPGSAAS
jgi:anti-sigma B factor antagonist